jgi:hypothetical protein
MATRTSTATMTTRHLAVRILITLGLVLTVGALFVAPLFGGRVLLVAGLALLAAGLAVLAPHDPPAGD